MHNAFLFLFRVWYRCRFIIVFIVVVYFAIVFTYHFTAKNSLPTFADKFYLYQHADDLKAGHALFNAVKILCLINSSKKEILNRAIHINATWARKCNKYYFLTFDENINLPFLDLKIPETRKELWNKWKAAFRWIYENELENFDYFLRADDDAYFIMENLRNILLPYNKTDALYFGARFKFENVPKGFMSGGAGVILTKSAIKRVVEKFDDASVCPQETTVDDDLYFGKCAQNLNITFIDTRDSFGRHRMLPWSLTYHFINGLQKEHFEYLYYPYHQKHRFDCCAEDMISFHYVYGEMLYMMEFLIYHNRKIKTFDEQLPESSNNTMKLKRPEETQIKI